MHRSSASPAAPRSSVAAIPAIREATISVPRPARALLWISALLILAIAPGIDAKDEPKKSEEVLRDDFKKIHLDLRPPELEELGSLEAWRRANQAAVEAMNTPSVRERIAKCEAFLKVHESHLPSHPVAAELLTKLVEAYLESRDYDPAHVAALLEKVAGLESPSFSSDGVVLVPMYYIPHKLPLESGRRLLERSRSQIAELRRRNAETQQDRTLREAEEQRLRSIDTKSYAWEGWLQLQHGDTSGALKTLLRAKESTTVADSLALVDERGQVIGSVASPYLDPLYLALAAAYARAGNRPAARKHLERIAGNWENADFYLPLIDSLKEALKETYPQALELRAEPKLAPDFTLLDLEGKKVSLSDYRGKVVFLNAWASWCYPCLRELQLLQQWAGKRRFKDVVVLAVNFDDEKERVGLPEFLETQKIGLRVLLGSPGQPEGYEFTTLGTMYLIDREGRIAGVFDQYYTDLEKRLNAIVPDLLAGKPPPGRSVLVVKTAPSGFGVLWKSADAGHIASMVIAPRLAGQPAEIGVLSFGKILRQSASGEYLGEIPIRDFDPHERGGARLQVADLDADGHREWLLTSQGTLRAIDGAGKTYWSHRGDPDTLELVATRDLNGDGLQELLLRDGDRVVALTHLGTTLWKTEPLKDLRAVETDPLGILLVQVGDQVKRIDHTGGFHEPSTPAPGGYVLSGTIDQGEGRYVDVFGRGTGYYFVPLDQSDLDGDGEKDLLYRVVEGLIAYDAAGSIILRVGGPMERVVVGDLDGEPGEEILISVENYGLVALGRKTEAPSGHPAKPTDP